ncbi:MAG TPA: radical SAM protein [Candidatus Nanoarchaeia archaeon]|nr:radical SAM protein [Candidatus Nanoarchaeia archaeon]
MQRILFIQPPPLQQQDLMENIRYPPLGITSIAGFMRDKGYIVGLYDGCAVKASADTVLQEVRRFKPDVVALTATSAIIHYAFAVAEKVKELDPSIKVVIGGPHATELPHHALSNANVDVLLRGEGELSLLELMKALEGGGDLRSIKGIGFMENGRMILTPPMPLITNIDELPFPAYDLLPINNYTSPYSRRKPFMAMVRTRGCPYDCSYCEIPNVYDRRFRVQSPERSIKEVDYLVQTLGVKEISFKDPIFTLLPKNVMEFCDLLIERDYDLSWCGNARVDNFSLDLAKKMKKAGCFSVTFGLESGDQRILDNLRKRATAEQGKEAVKIAKMARLDVVANFMVGNPGETKESIERTIQYMKEIDPAYVYMGFCTAFPGTALQRQAEQNDWILQKDPTAVRYEDLQMNATNLSNEELKQALNRMYRAFYFRPKYIARRMLKLKPADVRNNWNGFWSIVRNTLRVKRGEELKT